MTQHRVHNHFLLQSEQVPEAQILDDLESQCLLLE